MTSPIGVVASLTGPFASAASDENAGVLAWVKARGIAGRNIVFETLDDETNPVNTINVFRRLASDPNVHLIEALVNSNSAMAVKSIASEFKVPIVSSGAVEDPGVPADPWLFKVSPGPRDMMIVLCQYATKKGFTRLASLLTPANSAHSARSSAATRPASTRSCKLHSAARRFTSTRLAMTWD